MPTWKMILRDLMPFLFKKCPEWNYHWRWDRLCFCSDQGDKITDLKTGNEYCRYEVVEKMRASIQYCSKCHNRYLGDSHEYPCPYCTLRDEEYDNLTKEGANANN
jgi:hypothetical protein